MAAVTIRVHRRLVSALLDLSTVVASTQLVLDNDNPIDQLLTVKALLRNYHYEVVGDR